MNKKNYIQPSTEITLVALQQMVCVSGPEVGGTTEDEEDLLSREMRHSSIWDDDED